MNLIKTKDNNYTVNINNIFIHSKYSPLKEAEKLILNKISNTTTVVVIGPALGYLYKILEIIHPTITVIGIPLSKELGEISVELNKTDRKQWDTITDLHDFLTKNITIFNIKGLQIVEWEPTSRAFPELSTTVNKIIGTHIRRLNGNLLTTARFGKLWIRNSLKNYLLIEKYIASIEINKPIVIAASGKSLNSYIPALKSTRNNIFLISLSSANLALEYFNIKPDITFSTDPGYYSKLHLKTQCDFISMPLTNSSSVKSPTLVINQSNIFEEEIIKAGEIPAIKINENGTVAGTALEFALKNSNQNIYLVGQDLAAEDIITHTTPYAFDNLIKTMEDKTTPHYSIMFSRWINQGISFKTYRDWYESVSKSYPNRIQRINDTGIKKINGIEDITEINFINQIKNMDTSKLSSDIKVINGKPKEMRQQDVYKILNNWINIFTKEDFSKNPLFYLTSTSIYTDVNSKALSKPEKDLLVQKGKDESILFLKRLMSLYGRKLL